VSTGRSAGEKAIEMNIREKETEGGWTGRGKKGGREAYTWVIGLVSLMRSRRTTRKGNRDFVHKWSQDESH